MSAFAEGYVSALSQPNDIAGVREMLEVHRRKLRRACGRAINRCDWAALVKHQDAIAFWDGYERAILEMSKGTVAA